MIKLRDLCFDFPTQPLLKKINLHIPRHSFLAIIGPNGSGKSTLLKLIMGILHPQSGEIFLNQKPLREFSRKRLAQLAGYVPQHFETIFHFTAWEIVSMGRHPYQSPFSSARVEDAHIVENAMKATEVWHLRHRVINHLSGGELQRVVLASALAQNPQILLLDEPTTALDLKHQFHFYNILETLRKENNLTIVTVTHDINLASYFCEQMVVLKDGAIVAEGTPEQLITQELIREVFEVEVEIYQHPRNGKPLVFF
ncbi:MAG: ABC transporter ATP-binding protein [Calditrichaeota bacterium]|nr:MAG: ABC transporter ATP-binding protein [Calditrichota bacterium]